MAHIPRWQLTSIDVQDVNSFGPLIRVVWQCVACAMFLTDFVQPAEPSRRAHKDSQELDDA